MASTQAAALQRKAVAVEQCESVPYMPTKKRARLTEPTDNQHISLVEPPADIPDLASCTLSSFNLLDILDAPDAALQLAMTSASPAAKPYPLHDPCSTAFEAQAAHSSAYVPQPQVLQTCFASTLSLNQSDCCPAHDGSPSQSTAPAFYNSGHLPLAGADDLVAFAEVFGSPYGVQDCSLATSDSVTSVTATDAQDVLQLNLQHLRKHGRKLLDELHNIKIKAHLLEQALALQH